MAAASTAEPSEPVSQLGPFCSQVQQQIIGKPVRVELIDGRHLTGILSCLDKNLCMFLSDTYEQKHIKMPGSFTHTKCM